MARKVVKTRGIDERLVFKTDKLFLNPLLFFLSALSTVGFPCQSSVVHGDGSGTAITGYTMPASKCKFSSYEVIKGLLLELCESALVKKFYTPHV